MNVASIDWLIKEVLCLELVDIDNQRLHCALNAIACVGCTILGVIGGFCLGVVVSCPPRRNIRHNR